MILGRIGSITALNMMRFALESRLPSFFQSKGLKPAHGIAMPQIIGKSFSTEYKNRRDDDEFFEKTFSDEFDESDSLEVGKHKLSQSPEPSGVLTSNKENWSDQARNPLSYQRQRVRTGFPETWHRFTGAAFDHRLLAPRPWPSGFDDASSLDLFPFITRRRHDIMSLMHEAMTRSDPSLTLIRSSPGYDIREHESEYEVSIQVPAEMNASDLFVKVDDSGTYLLIAGHHDKEENGIRVCRDWQKSFVIGDNIECSRIKANLSNGLLIIKAPKLFRDENNNVGIHITEKPHSECELPEDSFDPSQQQPEASNEHLTRVDEISPDSFEKPQGSSNDDKPTPGREILSESIGISYGTARSYDTSRRNEVPHENTRYSLADHKDDEVGFSKEYPAA